MSGNGSTPIARPSASTDALSGDFSAQSSGQPEDDDLKIGPLLQALLQALRRRRRLGLTAMAVTVVVGAAFSLYQRVVHPIYAGGFNLLVDDPINTSGGSESDSTLKSLALPETGSTNTGTLIQVLGSPMLLNPVESGLGLALGSLGGRLSINANKASSDVLEMGLEWPDPQQGQEILEVLSREYLNYSLNQRQEKLTQGLAFLDRQAPELQQRVNRLQNELSNFRQANNFVAPEEQAAAIQARRQQLANQQQDLQQRVAQLQAQASAVRGGRSKSAASQVGGKELADGTFSKPLEDLKQVEEDLAEAQVNFTDSSPLVVELLAKRDRLRTLLQRRELDDIQSSLSENQSQQNEISRQLQQLDKRFRANPQKIKQYDALQQQLEVARANLTSYIQTRESFRLQVAQRTVPWKVISPPGFGGRPVRPNLQRSLMMSLLLGGVVGVGAALLRDRLDPVFYEPGELKDALPLPLLGVVPYLSGTESRTISEVLEAMEGGERFEVRESLRNLFANFRMLRADKTVRLVAITSATPGEGKTTSTALFAQTLVQLGQRVLLVDADMRRPRLHRYLGLDNGVGLSSLLTDASLDVAATVQTAQSGLDLLSAGPMPPDATRLLSSKRCAVVVEQIRQLPGYDLVLFDTPPALPLGDPVLLAEHLDGLLFVVGLGRVNRELPMQAFERVRSTGVDVLGMVGNQPYRRVRSRSGYGYGYGYGSRRYGEHYGGYEHMASHYDTASENGNDAAKPTPALARSGVRKFMRWINHSD